ncbi:TIM barrel protein [Halocynthiibacter sp. C4]|uniref:hydroxypyruvate isomerase family protein n=1 Tax=Halocynthiibacter sp. C4 TaxID=2992758 RepID=UPI00237C406A|nr:TIM barrel protein [Halocynthiibacter sp. C4]MDE0591523.1 TIM barrel protein [Halocynthiibacter sp. C4]
MKFSANLGFLWADLSLPDAIRAAKRAGFDAVECHWPYNTPPAEVTEALLETGLPMLGLNTARGHVTRGENGLAAVPNRINAARAAIDQAIDYAVLTHTANIHVMAGIANGPTACKTFIENLRYACHLAAPLGKTILIEPLNAHDAPNYFLRDTEQAAEIIDKAGAPNLKLMFDCYHVGRTEGRVISRLRTLFPLIGHVQFASVPDRGAPDQGAVDYAEVFAELNTLGYTAPLGAEYRPEGKTEDSLGWLSADWARPSR